MPDAARALLCTLLVVAATPLVAQERSRDRRAWMDSTTRTTDDPRRIPLPPERADAPRQVLVIRGGRIIDGTGAAAREGTLVLSGNRIARILAPDATDWPRDARVIDASGKTVMPGLIDLHTHLSYMEPGIDPALHNEDVDGALRGAERLRYYIESGITSVRDVGSYSAIAIRLKDWVAANRLPGPRVFASGRGIVGRGGHGAEGDDETSALRKNVRQASGPDDWREAVREEFKAGADLIKLMSHFTLDEIRAAVDEAHALGLKVAVDAETFYIDRAVEAGADVIEHPLPRSDETIRRMAAQGIAADPTLVPYEIIFDENGGYWGSTSRRFTFSKEANLEMVRRLRRAGVKLGIGTDLVSNWFRYLPGPYLVEMQRFQAAGFTPLEVLTIATRTNAEILDMDDKLGTLAPGKLADVLIVAGRPDRTLDDITKVDTVIRDGHVVVEGGRVVIPRHVPLPMPGQRPATSGGGRR